MDNPVKAALNPSTVLKTAAVIVVVMALAELTGLTSFFLSPIATLKARFGSQS